MIRFAPRPVFRFAHRTGDPSHSNRLSLSRNPFVIVGIAILISGLQRALLLASAIQVSHKHGLPISMRSLFITGYKHWDSSWYISLAAHGYRTLKDTAFWPLYPWTLRVFHALSGRSYMTCGIVISTISFVVAVALLGLLVRRNLGLRTAVAAMTLYAFFPTSFYFEAVYTEALFMALLIGAAYAANTGKFALANILAALGTLTRNTGIFICLIVLAEYIRLHGIGWRVWLPSWWKSLGLRALLISIAPLSLLAYCLWLKHRFGRFFAFLDAEKIFNRSYMSPWRTISGDIHLYLHPNLTILARTYTLFEAETFLFAVITLVFGLFVAGNSATRWAWWVYTLCITWIVSSEPAMDIPDYLLSVPRFILMLFPCFIFLAQILRRWWLVFPVVVLFAEVLFVKNGLFFMAKWIA